jgi:hypothetical protein
MIVPIKPFYDPVVFRASESLGPAGLAVGVKRHAGYPYGCWIHPCKSGILRKSRACHFFSVG